MTSIYKMMERKKIIHLLPDSNFSNFVTKRFEDAGLGVNKYVYLYLFKRKTTFIKDNPLIEMISLFSIRFLELLKSLSTTEAIGIHYLSTLKAIIAQFAHKRTKLVWFMWGSDFYDNIPKLHLSTITEETKKILRKSSPQKWLTRYLLFPFLSKIYNPVRSSMKLMDFCAPVCYEDYLLAKAYLGPNCQYLPFSYAIVSPRDPQNQESKIIKNILVGNSASPTNNHLDIVKMLSTKKLSTQKVIIPLSYGNKKYGRKIIQFIPEKMKENIFPLVEFMPKDEYLKLINTCSIGIFNYKRQEGLGNIIELLANGCKLYINKGTSLWDYLSRIGLIVFSIEEHLQTESTEFYLPLPDSDAHQNYQVIMKEYGDEAVKTKIKDCISGIYQ